MELSKEDFRNCKSITFDKNFAIPKIRMCRDIHNKQLMHEFESKNLKSGEALFDSLLVTWNIVKEEMKYEAENLSERSN